MEPDNYQEYDDWEIAESAFDQDEYGFHDVPDFIYLDDVYPFLFDQKWNDTLIFINNLPGDGI